MHKIEGVSNIRDVCCTHENILLLENNGIVYEWHHLNDEKIGFTWPFQSVNKISCGYDHAVLLHNGGNVYCKGSNYCC